MKQELSKNKDVWAGVMFIAIGAAAMFIARDYRFGSALQMGPGYFPRILGGILILFGVAITAVGLKNSEKIAGRISLRAVIVLPLSLILFGYLMSHVSLLPALVAVIWGAAAAGRQFKLLEVSLLTVLLITLAVVVFVWGLRLPYPLIKGF